jgi:hypothetical protein
MTLTEFLEKNGYARVPLAASGVGHFHAEGFLNDRAISVLIDTGASGTVFSLDLAKDLNLATSKMETAGGGVGSARLEVYQIEAARFTVGSVAPDISALYAMDFTHVNEALAMKGERFVDAVLGADALAKHEAVIDYGSSSLYLKM